MLFQFKTWLFRVKRVPFLGAQPLKLRSRPVCRCAQLHSAQPVELSDDDDDVELHAV